MHLLLILIDHRQIDGVFVLDLLLALRECLVIIINDGLGLATGDHADHPHQSYRSDDREYDIDTVSRKRYEVTRCGYHSHECDDLQVHLSGLARPGEHSQ